MYVCLRCRLRRVKPRPVDEPRVAGYRTSVCEARTLTHVVRDPPPQMSLFVRHFLSEPRLVQPIVAYIHVYLL